MSGDLLRYRWGLYLCLAGWPWTVFADQRDSQDPKPGHEVAGARVSPTESKAKGSFELAGRVFVRGTLSRVDITGVDAPWLSSVEVASARLAGSYRVGKQLKASVEVEFSDDQAEFRDVYIRARLASGLRLRAGHFKLPVSQMSLLSAWKLPLVRRGLLNGDVENAKYDNRQLFAGRSEGLQLRYKYEGPVEGKFFLAVFNSEYTRAEDRERSLVDSDRHRFGDVYGRAELTFVDDVEVGASLGWLRRIERPASDTFAGTVDRTWFAGVDVYLKKSWIRAIAEGYAAGSHYLHDNFDASDDRAVGTTWGARGLVWGRIKSRWSALKRIEPFAMYSTLRVTTALDDSTVQEYVGGVSVLFRPGWRVQAQYSKRTAWLRAAESSTIYGQLGFAF